MIAFTLSKTFDGPLDMHGAMPPDGIALPLEQPPSSNCSRCQHHESVLEVAMVGGAGLSDRFFMLSVLGNLAGSLCARLDVGPPCHFLAAKHNFGERLNCTVRATSHSPKPSRQAGPGPR